LPPKGDVVDFLKAFADTHGRKATAADIWGLPCIDAPQDAIQGDSRGLIDAGDMSVSTTPEPLPELPSVEPFDYDYLPKVVRAFVSDIAERSQCAPDYVAVSTLVMLSSIIGRKMAIRPKARDSWAVIPNLWGAVIGKSGSNKSHSISSSLRPIYALERDAKESHKRAIGKWEEENIRATAKKKASKDAMNKALKADINADISGFNISDDEANAPKLNRYVVGDITYEKLADLMVENPNGLLSSADELISVLKRLDKQGQEEARGFYLTGADGDKGYSVDRIIRGSSYIDAVCLSIIGGIQPSVLAEYVRQATGGGAGADGLLLKWTPPSRQ
jgi:putative DNA primase/helicase